MNKVVALTPEQLNFIFHCTDGDLYTYIKVVNEMQTIQDAKENSEGSDNSIEVPFDKSIVTAGIILQEIGIDSDFYQSIGKVQTETDSIDAIDRKTLKAIIRFYEFVGNFNKNTLYFDSIDQLIEASINNFVTADILEDLNIIKTISDESAPRYKFTGELIVVGQPITEHVNKIIDLFSFYKNRSFSKMNYREQLELIDLENNPQLIIELLKVRDSKEYQRSRGLYSELLQDDSRYTAGNQNISNVANGLPFPNDNIAIGNNAFFFPDGTIAIGDNTFSL